MRGGMNHLALTVSNLRMSEERFHAPVLGFLGYEQIETQDGMSVWLNAHATPIGAMPPDSIISHSWPRAGPTSMRSMAC
jgi:hypothetical protein